jgi:hypothetical protein
METIKLEGRDLLAVKLNAKDVPFNKDVKAKMKELGYNSYAKFTYNGIMFTSNEVAFLQAVESNDLAFLELEQTMLEDAEGNLTKPGYNVLNYYTYQALEKLETVENNRAMRNFKAALFNIDTLTKNPDLLSKLDLIEKIAEASA